MRPHRGSVLRLAALLLVLGTTGCTTVPTVTLSMLTAPDVPPADIASGALDARFEPHRGEAIPLAAAPGTWWRITSRVRLDATTQPRLELSDVFLARVQLWRHGATRPERYATYGEQAQQRYATRGLALPLPDGIAPGESVYLRIDARGIAPLRVGLESQSEALRRDTRHTQARTALLTVMLVCGVLALGFGLGLGERSYLYFAVMVLCQVAHFVLIGGEVRYLPAVGDALYPNLQAARVAASLGTVASIEFLRMYLGLARRQPRLNLALLLCSAALGVDALASIVTAASWTAQLGNFTLLGAVALLLAVTVRGCIAGQRAAWFVLVAFSPAMVAAALRTLEATGQFSGPPWFTFLFRGSFAFACVLLTLGLAERMMTMRRERHAALLASERHARQLATASHDIRQPLLALRSAVARLAGDAALAPEVLERFSNSIQYLDQLAAQYTSAPGRAGAGGASPAPDHSRADDAQPAAETLSTSLLLRNIDLMFRDEAEAKGLRLRVRSGTASVTADAMAAMRIVSNLVANAVKYTQAGKVLVGCRRRGDRIVIVVADTGPGMTRAELARLMQAGERGAGAADTEGSGLGLAIASRLAAERGYAFHVTSTPGRGTMFTLELPRTAA